MIKDVSGGSNFSALLDFVWQKVFTTKTSSVIAVKTSQKKRLCLMLLYTGFLYKVKNAISSSPINHLSKILLLLYMKKVAYVAEKKIY